MTASSQPAAGAVRRTLVTAGGLSLSSYAVSFVLQFALPRVLLSRWNDGGYALYVAIMGYTGYLSVADAGVQSYLSQRLVALKETKRDAEYAALAHGGLRALIGLAAFGVGGISVWWALFGSLMLRGLARRAGLAEGLVFLAVVGQLVANGVALACSGWSVGVEQATARYARSQLFGLLRSTLGTGMVLVAAAAGAGAVRSILTGVLATLVVDAYRFLTARRWVPPTADRVPAKDVIVGARGGFVLMVAMATQGSLLPAVAASIAPLAVGAAVPGRTVSNATRVLASSVQNVIWTPLAARLAAEQRGDQAFSFWRRNAPLLSLVQFLGLPVLTLVAPFVVPRWLPTKSHEILGLLPVYCVEQAVFAAAVPAQMLLLATGRFGRAGSAFLAASLISVGLSVATMPRFGALGFAVSTLAGTALGLVPVVTALEWKYWKDRGQEPFRLIAPRLGIAALAALSGPLMLWSAPGATAFLAVLLLGFGAHVRRQRMG